MNACSFERQVIVGRRKYLAKTNIVSLCVAFQGELDSLIGDPLAPGPGEFPSISNFDQSLAMGRFSSEASAGPRVSPLPAVAEVCVCVCACVLNCVH